MIPLEDLYTDVIAKAQRGLDLSDETLAEKSGLPVRIVQRLKNGHPERAPLARLADALDLHADSLIALSEDRYRPEVTMPADGFAMFTTPYGGGMTVNAFLFWRREARAAIAFDTGSTCSKMLATAKAAGAKIGMIFLTHTHPDHVADLRRLREYTSAPIFVGLEERLTEPKTIGMAPGSSSGAGPLQVRARSTPGHSPGGMTYVVEGLPERFAVVGDAIFAGSMGGVAPELYAAALKANWTQIFSLPDDTILCPGHGPLTTVGLEKKHNPFYAGRS